MAWGNYQAPTSGAFGGTLSPSNFQVQNGQLVPVMPTAPAAPAAPSAPSSGTNGSGGSAVPSGFTAQTSTLPPDPVYQAAMGALTAGRDSTLGTLKGLRSEGLASYGYTEDPNNPGSVSFDPNNPYSQAALALRSFQNNQRGTTNSYAAQGQLYAGSEQNAQDTNAFNYGSAKNAIENALSQFLTTNTGQQGAAVANYDLGAAGALGQSVQSAPTNPLAALSSAATGGTLSSGSNGQYAITASNGPLALVPQSPTSSVKLASGWSIVYDGNGKPVQFLPPGS